LITEANPALGESLTPPKPVARNITNPTVPSQDSADRQIEPLQARALTPTTNDTTHESCTFLALRILRIELTDVVYGVAPLLSVAS
jgi:hypothetical protein